MTLRAYTGSHARAAQVVPYVTSKSTILSGVPYAEQTLHFYQRTVRLAPRRGKAPDGLTLVPWQSGRCLAWDAIVVDTLAPLAALAATHFFVLVAIETSGAWCPQSAEFIEDPYKTDLYDYQRAARDNTSLPEDVSNTTERQCSRLPQHFPRVLIFYPGMTILTGIPYCN